MKVSFLRALAATGWVLTGCNDLDVCNSSIVELERASGDVYRCTLPEECPRSSREFVCVTDVSPEQACISCVDTRCVRVVPEPCS